MSGIFRTFAANLNEDMTQENRYQLLRLLQQHKELGISDQIDFEKFYQDSIIANSISLVDCDCGTVIDQSEIGKWSIRPSLAEKMVDKQKAQGGNKNRTYRKKT